MNIKENYPTLYPVFRWLCGRVSAIFWRPCKYVTRKIFCWKTVRRITVSMAVCTTLVALFYVEENWRAEFAYKQLVEELGRKGVSLDLKAYEDRFPRGTRYLAQTPIFNHDPGDKVYWKGVALQFGEVYEASKRIWDVEGMGCWWRDEKTDTSLWNDKLKSDVLGADGRGIPVYNEIYAAVGNSDALFVPTLNEHSWMNGFPVFNPLYYFDNGHFMKTGADLARGDSSDVDIDVLFKSISLLSTSSLGISWMNARTCAQHIQTLVWEGQDDHRWTKDQLDRYMNQAMSVDMGSWVRRSMMVEGIFSYDFIMQSSRVEWRKYIDRDDKLLFRFAPLFPRGWILGNKISLMRALACYSELIKNDTLRPGDFVVPKYNSPYSRLSWGGDGMWLKIYRDQKAGGDLLKLSLALEKYYLENGKYPAGLNRALDDYPKLSDLRDPYSGTAYHYRQEEAGAGYALWSVGLNGVDDGGVIINMESRGIYNRQGDIVWRIAPN